MCRKRISVWVRHATKSNSLINQTLWKKIQTTFPERIQARTNGEGDCPDDGKFSYKLFKELIKMKVLNQPDWMSEIKPYNILRDLWYKVIKLKNNKVKTPDIFTECIKVYGNETLIYYWIN